MRAALGLLGAFTALAGCAPADDHAGRDDQARSAPATEAFTVDSAEYTLRRDGAGLAASIGFVYRNRTGDTVSVVNCNGHVVMDLQKRDTEGWQTVWRGLTNACASVPLRIAPDDSLAGRVEVWGAEAGSRDMPAFETETLDGDFRLIWHQPRLNYRDGVPNFGDTLALADRVTTPFRLRRPVR